VRLWEKKERGGTGGFGKLLKKMVTGRRTVGAEIGCTSSVCSASRSRGKQRSNTLSTQTGKEKGGKGTLWKEDY